MQNSSLEAAPTAKPRSIRRLALVFVTASMLDWTLTWWLLSQNGDTYEANPLAAAVLTNFGWGGLWLFKFVGVATVVALGQVIGRYKPAVARRLLTFGCAALAFVLLYSSVLIVHSYAGESDSYMNEVSKHTKKLAHSRRESKHYIQTIERLGEDLKYHRLKLREAVEILKTQVACYKYIRVAAKLDALCGEVYDFDTCLACELIRRTGILMMTESEQWRHDVFQVLSRQFRSFHTAMPEYANFYFIPVCQREL